MSSVPPDYVKAASFTTLAQQPITTAGLPGTQLDNEFVNISTTVNKTIDRLSEIQQDDGKLRSNVVTIGSLSPDTAAAIAAAGSTIYGEWVAGKAYAPSDIIVYGSDGYAYMAAIAHTSGADFNADFSNKAWAILGWRPTTSNLIVKTFTGNGSQLTFNLLVNPVSETNTQVFVNGVYKSKSTYDISGTNLVFTAGNAPANAAAIEVVIGVAAELINNIVTIPDNSVGTTALINLAVTGGKIADTTITTGKLADQSVTAAKIENNTITSAKIQDLSVTESKLVNAAVTGQKIATGTIIESNLADASVGSTKIANESILNSKMAANSVGSTNVIDGSVTSAKIAADAVTTAKILDSNVTTEKIAGGAVTTIKIADANVTTAKIADASITAAKLSGAQTGSAPIYGVRAWVVFDMTRNAAGGTDSANTARYIYANGNVSSVVKNNTGDFTVNFTTVLPDTFYTYSGSGLDVDETGDMIIGRPASGGKTTAGIRLKAINLSGTGVNRSEIAVSFIR
jgi:uncharacterized protein YjbI with pentapeptide repeats